MILFGHYLIAALLYGFPFASSVKDGSSCECIGVDYSDAGSYLIDSGVDGNFSFASEFQGNCDDSIITTSLLDSDGNSYNCSSITPLPTGSIQISTCDIKYSSLTTGVWQILIFMSSNDTIRRSFKLTVGAPATVVTTITPTIIIGTTIAPPPATVTSTAQETTSTTLLATTLTTPCGTTATVTTTIRQPPTTTTQTSTFLQYTTDAKLTLSTTIISTITPSCFFTITVASTITPAPTNAAATITLPGPTCVVEASWGGRGGGWRGGGWGRGSRGPPAWVTSMWAAGNGGLPPWVSCASSSPTPKAVRKDVAGIAAWTSTYLQTTYTATQTSTVYLPAVTVTQYAIHTVVQTITPAPSTLCAGVNMATKTLTATASGGRLTKITIVTSVTHIIETVFITSTQVTISSDAAAATACWQEGGTFGAGMSWN